MFNKETEYALRSLVYIQVQNCAGRKPGVTEIAREIEAPHFFTAKILQRLVKAGLVRSMKGKGGGFYFDPDMPDMPISDILTVTEGNRRMTGCGFGLKHCDAANPCPLHDEYAPIREAMDHLVSTETIRSLAERQSKVSGQASSKF